MKVKLYENSKKSGSGLAVQFPYKAEDVTYVKNILGVSWDKSQNMWVSEGPEILLDMQRFGIEIEWISKDAREIAEGFRQQLWQVMDARAEDIEREYAYQEQGSKILASMPFMILGDDMGLGKTKQSLDAAAQMEATRILVLCPKTLCYNWEAEITKWHPEWTSGVVPDTRTSTKKIAGRDAFWKDLPNIVIANYEKTRLYDWPDSMDWDVVICDEASKLKNHATVLYKAVRRIIRKAKTAWALTGTPLEIRLTELYNILSILRPAVLGNYMRFAEQHVIADWAGTVIGSKNLELLRDRISPFMLRRTKKEVLRQLPPKIYNNVFIKLSTDETAAYQALTSQFNNWLDEHDVSGGGNPLTEMLRMRQFCATPALWTDELGRGSKFEMLKELTEEWNGKIVIFCFFEQVVSRLQEWLGLHPEAVISGNVPSEQIIPRITRFNEGELGNILVSTDAGQQGLNITGADMIIHYDQLFNPQKMHQREDRLHRIGQVNNVTVVNMLCLDTIDVGMYQLNREREHLFEEVVDGAEEALLRKLDAPRLKRIVEGRLNNDRLD